jgi:hypothetical protein
VGKRSVRQIDMLVLSEHVTPMARDLFWAVAELLIKEGVLIGASFAQEPLTSEYNHAHRLRLTWPDRRTKAQRKTRAVVKVQGAPSSEDDCDYPPTVDYDDA